ncbi:Tda4p [Lachancea thermotolerans CBS 6340]|uniref:KLTH0E01320p n=1 Tax=Lachancea thermotolerans (strain ATCC 56472 / CBS 6340 / NRRL Y-8284) TaxID=559295 RepID=C5DH48_LACTC|nr:KLTH0E01320p [Lachancea thermotolerans CBS 6340]CAR23109.1 KLTH0E01320p [Lachancea thermotolerans CBS 6340]
MEDPFLKFSPFAGSDNLLVRHSLEIIGSFLVYQVVLSRWLVPRVNALVFGRHYTELKDKDARLNFDIHTVSMFQCVVSLGLTWPILFQPLSLSIVSYQDSYTSMISAITCGYFLWDLYVCLKHFSLFGIGFLGHAMASLYVFVLALRPFCQSWVGKFLIFEASTPFVNINWFISQLSRTSSRPVVPMWFNALNGLLLIGTFFVVRVLWGFTAIAILCAKLWEARKVLPTWIPTTVITLNLSLDALNLFWLSKMIKIAKKMASGSKQKGH